MNKKDTGSMLFNRKIEIRDKVDVFIVGGGPAGVAAAVAAAEHGKSVYIIEKQSCFGGMGTGGLVPMFAVLSDGVNFVASGVGKRVYDMCGYKGMPQPWTPIDAEVLKRVYDDIVIDSGASFSFDTLLIGVENEGAKVKYAICAAKSGIFAIQADIFIDASGDGDLAALAGAEYKKGDENGNMMPPTLCGTWTNIDWNTVEKIEKGWGYQQQQLEAPIKDGVFTYPDLHLPGIFKIGKDKGGGNLGHTFGVDSTDEASLTKGLVLGRKQQLEYERFYKEYLKGYENMQLITTGSILGIRESRRIVCDYTLTVDAFVQRAVFEDEIGRYSYPVDVHSCTPDKDKYEDFLKEFTTMRYKPGESYGIPYRCLAVKGFDNMLTAGRCICCDRQILGSVRVMPGCFITGQAAGIAAAIALDCENNVRGFDVKLLQSKLKQFGAFLPNC